MLQWGNTPSSRHCIRFSRGPGVLLTPCDAGSGRLPSGRCAPPSFAFGPCRPHTFRRVAWGLHAVASFAGPRSSPLRALALLRSSPLAQRRTWRPAVAAPPTGATVTSSWCNREPQLLPVYDQRHACGLLALTGSARGRSRAEPPSCRALGCRALRAP